MFIFLAALISELAIGSTFGLFLAKRFPKSLPVIAIGLVLYIAVSMHLASLATQYPGPDSKYLSDPHARWMRSYVTGPATMLWVFGPLVSAAFVSYWQASRNGTRKIDFSIENIGYSSAISLVFLPIWIVGASIHGANVVGAWF